MNDPLNILPGYLLRRISNALHEDFSAQLSHIGLRPSDASALFLIEANPKITPSALGQILGIKRANMVPIIARLEKQGLTQRVAIDGRSYGLSFTTQGQEAYRKVKRTIKQHEDNILDRVPEKSRTHFVKALEALWLAEQQP
jgi:DNA-binding MarR family transcriptional regulator